MPLRLGLGEMPADFVPATVEDQKACREAMRANSIEGEFGIKIRYIGWCTPSKLPFNNLLDHEDIVGSCPTRVMCLPAMALYQEGIAMLEAGEIVEGSRLVKTAAQMSPSLAYHFLL